jgi:hypothetical protein
MKTKTKVATKKNNAAEATIKNPELLEYYFESREKFLDNVRVAWKAVESAVDAYNECVDYILEFLEGEKLFIDEETQDTINEIKDEASGPFDFELFTLDSFVDMDYGLKKIENFIIDSTPEGFNNSFQNFITKRNKLKN